MVVALSLHAYGQEKPEKTLPAVVTDAIKAAYPNAKKLRGRGRKDLKYGVMAYNVRAQNTLYNEKGEKTWVYSIIVRVTDKGTLIFVSENIKHTVIPLRAKIALKKAAGEDQTTYWRRLTYFVDEKLAKYNKPRVQYKVSVKTKDKTFRSIEVDQDGGMTALWRSVKETELPKAVTDAMKKAAGGGRISGICHKFVTYVDEKMAKLGTPRVEYEIWLRKDEKATKIRVSADGTVIDQIPWFLDP